MMGEVALKFSQLFAATLLLSTLLLSLAEASNNIGVSYGLMGNNLPPPNEVINLYQKYQIKNLRMHQPHPEVLEALRGSNITVVMGPTNDEIESLASCQESANSWVNTSIVPYKDDVKFKWITVGNEIIPGPLGVNVPAAMNNIQNALICFGLSEIKVTTVIAGNALSSSYPPSDGAFAESATTILTSIAELLLSQETPLMINVSPYFAYTCNPNINISSEYALFTSSSAVLIDGNFLYFNLFDAMVDVFNVALEKINLSNVRIAVAETGWPTLGNPLSATPRYAQTYNKNLLKHACNTGTPRRPLYLMDIFFSAMFNENMKEKVVEQNFGFFFSDMTPVYRFWPEWPSSIW